MRFLAFVWKVEPQELTDDRGKNAHWCEVELADMSDSQRGEFVLFNGPSTLLDEYEGQGIYEVTCTFRRREMRSTVRVQSIQRQDGGAHQQEAAAAVVDTVEAGGNGAVASSAEYLDSIVAGLAEVPEPAVAEASKKLRERA